MNIVCNENVSVKVETTGTYPNGRAWSMYEFTPSEGYVLWRDNETSNIDSETGEPWCYWTAISAMDAEVEDFAHHIYAKSIDETMEDFSNAHLSMPMLMTLSSDEDTISNHTYIDENGVEREKKGIY